MLQCKRCNETKEISLFRRKQNGTENIWGVCNGCRKETERKSKEKNADTLKKWRENNKEKLAGLSKKWAANNLNKRLFFCARRRAQKQGLEFNIEVSDIIIPERCPALGLPLCKGEGLRQDASPSLDRINPKKGYVKGNIQVLSWRANHLKSNGTLEELEKLIAFMKS